MIQTYAPTLFGKAAAELGRHPFPHPTGNLSQPYTNPLGAQIGCLHILRILREIRLRQLFQGEPANDHPALADDERETSP